MTRRQGRHVLVAGLAGLVLAVAPAVFAQAPIDPVGQPSLQVRSQPAYYVWVDGSGWHVRWVTPFPQLFSGIVTTDGEIRQLRRAGGGLPGWISQLSPQSIGFATATFPGTDGIDFQTTGSSLTFNLRLNAFQVRVSQVFIGRAALNPQSTPFRLVALPALLQQLGKEPMLSDIQRPVDRDR